MEKYSQIDAAGFTRLSGENVNPLEVLSHELGDKFDRYRGDWDKVNSFELETEFPISIDFETVSSCNLECVMCSLGYKKNKINIDVILASHTHQVPHVGLPQIDPVTIAIKVKLAPISDADLQKIFASKCLLIKYIQLATAIEE